MQGIFLEMEDSNQLLQTGNRPKGDAMKTIVAVCACFVIGSGVTGCGGSDDFEADCQAAAEIVMQDLLTRCTQSYCDFCTCLNENKAYILGNEYNPCGDPIDMDNMTPLRDVDCSDVGLDCDGKVTECSVDAISLTIGDQSFVRDILDGSDTLLDIVWDTLRFDNASCRERVKSCCERSCVGCLGRNGDRMPSPSHPGRSPA